ncbi:hypothetical protein A2U01_0088920, partial [Trifolium medium]|nr:hypothetical protein [Trifolium medium]
MADDDSNESVIKEYDQNLVGERVEVWWPNRSYVKRKVILETVAK